MMSKAEEGSGVRAARARARRLWMVVGAMAAIVFGTDAVLHAVRYHAPSGGYALSPYVAVTSAILLVVAGLGGTWLHLRLTDEVDVRDNLISFSTGFLFNASAYIIWVMLFLGGLAPAPAANWLFLSTVAVAALAYGWTKLRRLI